MNITDPIYKPLDPAKSDIRLIEILSARNDGLVECKLSTVSLDKNPKFFALSYVWGKVETGVKINLEGRTITVTTNLEAALRQVAYHWSVINPDRDVSSFRLWVDAICINQRDPYERASQVQFMRRIYRSAELVLSWLGPDDRSIAFGTIKIIADQVRRCDADGPLEFFKLEWMRGYPNLCEHHATVKGLIKNVLWAAFSDLLLASYWRRVWIFQEVALAHRLLMMGPDHCTLDWMELELVCLRLENFRSSLKDISLGTIKPDFVSHIVWHALTNSLDLSDFSRIFRARFFRDSLGNGRENANSRTVDRLDSEGWVISAYAGDLLATDPKDHIYGLLGLTGIRITPDYSLSKNAADVYIEYVIGWLEATRGKRINENLYPLSFLANAGIAFRGNLTQLPTWVPDFARKSQGSIESSTKVATGFADQQVFESDGDTYPYIMGTRSLFVWGVELEPIALTSEAPEMETWNDGRMIQFIRDFVSRHPKYVSGICPLEAFFRLGNRDVTSNIDKLVVLRALSFLRFLIVKNGRPMAERLEALGFVPGDFEEQFRSAFFPGADFRQLGFEGSLGYYMRQGLDGPIATVWDGAWMTYIKMHISWRYVETPSGYLGIAPVGTKPGDILCVLSHCEVPVLLRKSPGTERYNLVGTSFIIGLMNGEAADFIKSGRTKPRWFELQ